MKMYVENIEESMNACWAYYIENVSKMQFVLAVAFPIFAVYEVLCPKLAPST